MPGLLRLTLTVCSLLATSCYASATETRARHQFRGSFDCPSAVAAPAPGGYRVEGCGTTAFYRCSSSPAKLDPRFETTQHGSARDDVLIDGVFQGVDDAIKAPGRCELVSGPSGRSGTPMTTRPSAEAAPQVALALAEPNPEHSQMLTVPFQGGQLVFTADPSGNPDYVSLRIESAQPVFYEPCTPWLFHDGQKLSITALRFLSRDKVQLVLPTRSLRTLHKGNRLDAQVCGLRFSLDGAERALIADFVQDLTR